MKATRRELRRAVGPSALSTIQAQDQAIGILQNAVVALQREVAELAINHAEQRKRQQADWASLYRLASSAISQGCDFRFQPFRARFRWLFTGK